MCYISNDPAVVAAIYQQQHGADAVVYLDGDIAKALGQQRWTDYETLQSARRRLDRQLIFEQI